MSARKFCSHCKNSLSRYETEMNSNSAMSCHKCIFIFQIRYSEELGVSAEKASRLFIYQGLCSSAGRLLSGFLCNHPRVDTFKVYQAAQFTAGLSIILMTAVPTFSTLTICMVFYGLGDGFFNTSLSVLTFTASPLKPATLLGWRMTMSALFMASGPTLAGKCHIPLRRIQEFGELSVKCPTGDLYILSEK